MIWKVLQKNINKIQLSAAFIGVLSGLSLLSASIIFYNDIKLIFDDKEGFWRDEYIIVNKNIHSSDAFRQATGQEGSYPVFTKSEIEKIRNQDFVDDLAEFIPATFSVRLFTGQQSMIQGFYTDLFFEAVPSKYIDVNYKEWNWNKDSEYIPMIIPRMYLNLYNFGFASGQKLPQISEEAAKHIPFDIHISGNNKKEVFRGKIIGFSERINTFLVPMEFIKWGNEIYGNEKYPSPGRLIVISSDFSNQEILEFFNENDFVANQAALSNTKALSLLNASIFIVLFIGAIIIALALWLMLVAIILVLERNKENILKLSMLGYNLKEISLPYKKLVIIITGSMYLLSFLPLYLFRLYYSNMIELLGYSLSGKSFIIASITVFFIVSAICIFLITYIHNQIKKIIK